LIAAIGEIAVAFVAFVMKIVAAFLVTIMSASYLSAHKRGISRIAIFSAFLLVSYLLLAILRGYIVGFASPKLSFFFNPPLIALVSLALLFLVFVPFSAKHEQLEDHSISAIPQALIQIFSFAFVITCLALWSELIRVPKMEARYCRAAIERLNPEIEDKANFALEFAGHFFKEDNLWLKSCQELSSTP
jgi:hypothetical protein